MEGKRKGRKEENVWMRKGRGMKKCVKGRRNERRRPKGRGMKKRIKEGETKREELKGGGRKKRGKGVS